VSEKFVCFDLSELGKTISSLKEQLNSMFKVLTEKLADLVDRGKGERADPLLAQNIATIYHTLHYAVLVFGDKLEISEREIKTLVRSHLCGLARDDICTYREFEDLERSFGRERAVVECLKKNIVECREVTSEFFDLEEGARAVEVIYYEPTGELAKRTVVYRPGSEKIRGAFHPIVPAAYEKCLLVRVEIEESK
jgi:hypothetical protein